MNDTKYQGWINYETWNAALWVDNDQGLYSSFTGEAQRCWDEADGDDKESDATSALADVIKEYFETDAEQIPHSGWMADAINAYLGSVDWREIAEHYMDDVEKS